MNRFFYLPFLISFSFSAVAGNSVGMVAIYSDGKVEKLIEKSKQWTIWEDQRKRVYKRSSLPYMPVLEYQKYPDREKGYTQTLIYGNPANLKPSGDETSVLFKVNRVSSSSGSSDRNWRCDYVGKGSFKVDKKYRTHKYRCVRFGYWKMMPVKKRETQEISYSPTLDLVVYRKTTDRYGKSKEVTLEKVLSAKKATAKRISRIVYNMRKKKREEK